MRCNSRLFLFRRQVHSEVVERLISKLSTVNGVYAVTLSKCFKKLEVLFSDSVTQDEVRRVIQGDGVQMKGRLHEEFANMFRQERVWLEF